MYTTLVVLHLISVGIGVGIVTLSIIGRVKGKAIRGTAAELIMYRSMAINGEIMGKLAIGGLLITGVAMSWMNYSFFPVNTLPWLFIKQCVFILLLIVAFTGTIPRGEKIKKMAMAELQSPNAAQGASEELRALISRQFATVIVIGILVLINMSLGESKAMMWVTGQ
jgi:hypothetical protein